MGNGRDSAVAPRFQRFRRRVAFCLGMTPGAICFAGVVYVTSVNGANLLDAVVLVLF